MKREQIVRVMVLMGAAASGCGGGALTGAGPADTEDSSIDGGGDAACRERADCDDLLYCNGAEWCDGGQCRAGELLTCSDGVACTVDSCDEVSDRCEHTADDGSCSGGLCDPTRGCWGSTGGACTSDADCDDGLFCNGLERCGAVAGCQPGQAISCDDGIDCSVDVCSEESRGCVHTCDEAPEADGVPGGWTCDPAYHDADDGCDCGCGVRDPDCDLPDVTVYGCDDGEVCGPGGTCASDDEPDDDEGPEPGDAPEAWCCDDSFYDANDGCDCECGAHDPDCEEPDATLYGCPDGQTCSWAGVCEDAGDWW